jgi:hypothetical protein
VLQVIEKKSVELTAEGSEYYKNGTPEVQYANALEMNVTTLKSVVDA